MRISLVLVLLSASAACATAPRAPIDASVPAPPTASRGELRRMVAAAKQEIDSAVSAGNVLRLMSVVNDTARIITASGEIVSGVAPIAQWLTRDTTIRVARVRLLPMRSEYCVDGVLEWGGNAVVFYASGGRFETLVEPYSLRWALEPDGTLRLRKLTLGEAGKRPTRVDDCPSRPWVTARDARVHLWLAPPYATADWSAFPDDFTDRIRGAGYGNGNLARPSHRIDGYEGTDIDNSELGLLGLRVRVRGPFSVELLQPLGKAVARVQGYDPETFSHISVDHEGWYSAAIGSYRWRAFRVGAGPFRIASRWRQQESAFEFAGGSWTSRGPVVADEWRSTTWGLLTRGSIAFPLGGMFASEAFLQHRGFASEDIPGTSQTGPISANVGGLGFGFTLGIVF